MTSHKHDPELQKELDDLKHNINDLKALFIKKISQTADKVPQAIQMGEDKIQDRIETHPFSSVGFAAAIGFIVGALFTCKK